MEIRKDYLKRLIAGVREAKERDPDTIKAKEELGSQVTIAKWVDAELLCMVIENEILNNEDIQSEEL